MYHKQPVKKPLTSDAVVTPEAAKARQAKLMAAGPKNKLNPSGNYIAGKGKK